MKTKKKGLHQKWNTFFSPNSGEEQKKKNRSSPEIEHFFKVLTCAQMHTIVKLWKGMQMKTILNLLGGIQSNYWRGYIPPFPPCFGTTGCWVKRQQSNLWFRVTLPPSHLSISHGGNFSRFLSRCVYKDAKPHTKRRLVTFASGRLRHKNDSLK